MNSSSGKPKAPPTNRKLSLAVTCFLGFLILHVVCCKLGYREGIDLQYYPAYKEASEGGWICLASMDSVWLLDVSKPYSGWPVLYGFLLALPSKVGLSYEAGVAIVNAIIGLCTAGLLFKLLKPIEFASGALIILATCLTGAYWSSANTAFAHRLIPLGMLLAIWSWGFWRATATVSKARARRISLVFIGGLIVGSMNWSCFFVVPVVACLSLFHYFRNKDKALFSNDIGWCLAFGFGTVAAFLVFTWLHTIALHDVGALAAPSSGNSSRIHERMVPSVRNIAAAGFFTALRSFWALLPLVPLLFFRREKLRNLPPESIRIMIVLMAACGLFIFTLSGEMAMAAHRFYVVLFLAPAAFTFCLLYPGAARFSQTAAIGLCLATTLFSLFGYKLLTPTLVAIPRQAEWKAGYINLSTKPLFALAGESYDLRSITRTAIRQWTLSPIESLEPDSNFAARQRDWYRGARAAMHQACPENGLVIGCSAELAIETYVCGRPLVFAPTLTELQQYLERLKPQILEGRIVLAYSGSELPAEMTAAISAVGIMAESRTRHNDVEFALLKPISQASIHSAP